MPQLLQKTQHSLALFILLSLFFLLVEEFDHFLEFNVHHALDLAVVNGWLKLLFTEGVVSQVVCELEEVYLKVFVVF